MQHVSFKRMDEGTSQDYAFLNALEDEFVVALPNRLLAALNGLEGSLAGYQISRLEHSLQSATRAEADGADIELIIGALIHELGDDLTPLNNPRSPPQTFATMFAPKWHGLSNIMAFSRCIIMAEQWVLIKTPVTFTATMHGLIAASNFAVIGIK